MKMLLRYIIILVIIGVVVILGMQVIKSKRAAEAELPVAVSYDMVVKTMLPKLSNATLTLPYLANTKSNNDVKISSRLSARIQYIAQSGTSVKKGDIIVKIDDQELKSQRASLNLNIDALTSQLKSTQIALKNLERSHERTQKLLEIKGASKEEFDKEVSNIATAKSGIDTLKFKIQELQSNKASVDNLLSYATIKSPINGVVTNLANVGDVAFVGKALISISTKANSYLLVRLPNNIDAKAILYNQKRYPLNALNTTYDGLLEYLANIDDHVISDQSVSVDVVIFQGNGYKLPHDAILNRDGKSYVLLIKKDRAIAKMVRIIADGEQGVVVDGLDPGARIVVAKQDILLKLLGGMRVKAVE